MDEINVEKFAIHLTAAQAKQYIFMQFLDSIGFFNSTLSQLVVDTDSVGQISHVSLKKNFNTGTMDFSHPIDKR